MNDVAIQRQNAFNKLLDLLRRLDKAKIAYTLQRVRDDAIMIDVAVPGQRWEIEFVDYGDEVHTEIERFVSNGEIGDEQLLETLFEQFSD
jgi:hypothetical protein